MLTGWELDQKTEKPYHKYIYVKYQKRRITAEGDYESGHWFLTQFHFNSLYVTTALLYGLLPNQQQHKSCPKTHGLWHCPQVTENSYNKTACKAVASAQKCGHTKNKKPSGVQQDLLKLKTSSRIPIITAAF